MWKNGSLSSYRFYYLFVILRNEGSIRWLECRIPALDRGRASHFCRHKSNQKGCQQKCFFAAQAFALQSGQNHGLQLFCPTLFAPTPALQQKLAMPLQPHSPSLFCPLSPEAYLLTRGRISNHVIARRNDEAISSYI